MLAEEDPDAWNNCKKLLVCEDKPYQALPHPGGAGIQVEEHPGGQVEHQADPEDASRMAREIASLPAFRMAIGCAPHAVQKNIRVVALDCRSICGSIC